MQLRSAILRNPCEQTRLPLSPGEYKLKVELHGRDERVLDSSEIKVTLRKGEKKYLSRHWIPTNLEVKP